MDGLLFGSVRYQIVKLEGHLSLVDEEKGLSLAVIF
jgi:hypothetical protein